MAPCGRRRCLYSIGADLAAKARAARFMFRGDRR
jgi:hypothetical protein